MNSKNNNIFYTIGHSNRPIKEFIDLLKEKDIKLLVDVRSLPGSSKYPQYNKENLSESLKEFNIDYIHLSKLGGLRKSNKNIDANINSYWKNKSFRNYANYAINDKDFKEGIQELIKLNDKLCAIMCAEAVWWKCHRRIITDYLLSLNKEVYHIINTKNISKAIMNESVKVINNDIFYN